MVHDTTSSKRCSRSGQIPNAIRRGRPALSSYRPRPASHYTAWPHAGALLKHHAQIDLIDASWDDLLRIGASLKQGYVSAALLVAKLQAGSRQHPLAKALLGYGKLLRTPPRAALWFASDSTPVVTAGVSDVGRPLVLRRPRHSPGAAVTRLAIEC